MIDDSLQKKTNDVLAATAAQKERKEGSFKYYRELVIEELKARITSINSLIDWARKAYSDAIALTYAARVSEKITNDQKRYCVAFYQYKKDDLDTIIEELSVARAEVSMQLKHVTDAVAMLQLKCANGLVTVVDEVIKNVSEIDKDSYLSPEEELNND